LPAPIPANKTLASSNIPTLLPAATDPNVKAPVPLKSPTVSNDQLKDSPKWPLSPRLRSPPPLLNKPTYPPPAQKLEQIPPAINVQRASPSLSAPEPQSDTDAEDTSLQPGMRTPARSVGVTATPLETVQEVSPFTSPKGTADVMEKLEEVVNSVASSQTETLDLPFSKSFVGKANLLVNESGSESGSIKAGRRSGNSAAPPLMTRQSSSSTPKLNGGKGKAGENSLQSMTVETETVTSIPQVALAPGVGATGTNGSLRTKPSTETIRPKKEKKKLTRRPPSVNAGTGEPSNLSLLRSGLRHFSSTTDMRISPTKYYIWSDEARSPRALSKDDRSKSLISNQVGTILTRLRPASSKADIFEAKVASAVEEANSSDSEETFVYDSNPPDRDRPQRFHSRTPSATSMVSQIDRGGMRSIHTVMENTGPPVVKKNMKFVNTFTSSGNDSGPGDDDGKGTGRSHVGSGRGTARHHHHLNRWTRPMGNGHPSLFAEDSPFTAPVSNRNMLMANNSRHSPGPTSPRLHNPNRGTISNGKRGPSLVAGYDLDDNVVADDETTPLIPSGSVRSTRLGRGRRYVGGVRPLEQQHYRSPPSLLNRFANCLVLTVMLLLVVSGAIGFMFATSQPLQNIELVSMKNVVASEQELMLDLVVQARNPNVVVVVVDAANLEVFAKSPHAGTDSEWWRRPKDSGTFQARRNPGSNVQAADFASEDPPPLDDKAPNMRLGTITEFDSPLSFEGSFFHDGWSKSMGGVRLIRPGNSTDGGSERWERILEDEFDLIIKGVLKYTLPLSQNVRSVSVSGRTTVKPNAANDPSLTPNRTSISINV
jgi:hypothetical protein